MKKIRIVQFGLGPIGLETLRLAADKPWAQIVGAIDNSPMLAGKNLGELTGVKRLQGCVVQSSLEALIEQVKPDLIFHTAVSRFKPAFAQLEPIARAGISVVSSCEELLFPQLREPLLARRLNQICRKSGARIVGAGVNPGFAMDLLPLCLTGVSREVRSVHVQRVVDASTRRGPLQRKIGSGLAPAEFRRLLNQGRAGHAGLKESLALIAHGLGWSVKTLSESGNAIVADHDIQTKFVKVKKGDTCGLHQRAEARMGKRIVISLDLKMYLDAANPHDAIQIEGQPPLNLVLPGGIAGDHATVAALVNTAPRLFVAPPGLVLLTDLAVPRLA